MTYWEVDMARKRLSLSICLGAAVLAAASCQQGTQQATKPTPPPATDNGSAKATLNVTFNGAIAFVPDDPQGNTYSRITALAAMAEDRAFGNLPKGAHRHLKPIPPHYAYLRVKTRNLCEDAGVRCAPRPEAGNATTLIPLHNDDIAFDVPSVSGSRVDKGRGVDSIPRLADFSQHGKICPGCVDLDFGANPDLDKAVAARLQFATGTFSVVGNPIADKNGVAMKWLFEYLPSDVSGNLSKVTATPVDLYEHTMWTVPLKKREIIVTLKTFPGGTTRKFKLHLAPADKGHLEIEFLNLPAANILGKTNGYAFEPTQITHFDWLYALAGPSAETEVFPFPVAQNGSSGGDPFCSNGIYKP